MRKFRYSPTVLNGNPIVQLKRQRCCQMDLSERVGLHRDTLRNWRTKHTPRINDIEAALNYLGYTLKVVKIYDKRED